MAEGTGREVSMARTRGACPGRYFLEPEDHLLHATEEEGAERDQVHQLESGWATVWALF